MKKITVKHYINKRLKSSSLYVRVIYNRKDTNFQSEIVTNLRPSDETFLNDETLKKEMQYESDIITSIIKFCIKFYKDEFTISHINIPSLINEWVNRIPDFYENIYLTNKEIRQKIRQPLIKLIAEKTQIEETVIDKFIVFLLDDIEVLNNLAQKHDIYESEIKKSIIYYSYLIDFERINYKDDQVKYGIEQWKYGMDNKLTYYDWKDKNKKDDFIEYALSRNELSKEYIEKRTEDFDLQLESHFKIATEMYSNSVSYHPISK